MYVTDSINSEVTFLTGVDQNGVLAPIAFETWTGTNPAVYGNSGAIKWGAPTVGTGATITYAFLAESAWTAEERQAFTTAMSLWSAIANVTFVEMPDEVGPTDFTADFRIVRGDSGAFWTFGELDKQEPGGTTLLTPTVNGEGIPLLSIDTSNPSFGPINLNFQENGGYPFSTVVHELGHGIGLGHGGPYNGEVDAETQQFGPYDMRLWTIMSYIDWFDSRAAYLSTYPVTNTNWGQTLDGSYRVSQSPMMLDILAAQRLYGAPTSGPLAEGGVVFGFNTTLTGNLANIFDFTLNLTPIVTLWSGGTGNSLDLSGFSQNAIINLEPGTFSSAAGLVNNIGIAFDTIIETAIGGSGNDRIFGTEQDNTLIGNAGLDIIYGGGGDDNISGGAGADFIVFGSTGRSLLSDTLEDLRGDIISGMGTNNGIEILGSLFDRSDIEIVSTADSATFTMETFSFRADGIFSGGDFMLTARTIESQDRTLVTFVNFLPLLSEGVTVDPTLINGVANEAFLTGDGATTFSMTMVSADSAFQNTLGYYKITTTGTISDVQLLIDNTMDAAFDGMNFALDTPDEGEAIGFFLIQDGFRAYGDLADDLSFVPSDAGGSDYQLYSASRGFLTQTDVFHSWAAFNPNDMDQVLSGVEPGGEVLQIGFEDLVNGVGDNDFQDVIIALQNGPSSLFVM
ncbi:MAG: M10 family metallopeptidase C-terminal domain-containing protein [Pseudomonadota bacterium]